MEEQKTSQGALEFSTNEIQLVNSGTEPYKATYQLQNRYHCLRRIRATIAKDSDPVFTSLNDIQTLLAVT